MRRLLLCCLAIACASCGSDPSPTPVGSDALVARVGATGITDTMFQLRLHSALSSVSSAGGPANNAAMTSQLRASVLRSLLIDTVIAQEAAQAGVAATTAEIAAQLQQDAAAAGGPSQLASQVASLGGSTATLQDEATSSINEQKLEDLLARERAAEVEQKLRGGATMASLAATYSDDSSSAPAGGELGVITRATISTGESAFSTAVFALRVGAYSTTPIRDSQGYDIVLVEAATPTSLTLRHIIVAAPVPYTVRQRPTWFSEAIFEQLATDCATHAISIFVKDVGDDPCAAAAGSPSASAVPSASATP